MASRHPGAPRRRRASNALRLPPIPPAASFALVLVVATVALLLVYARPYRQIIDVGGPGDRAATRGFFDRERSPAGATYRWTDQEATLIFRAAGLAFPANQPVSLELSLVAGRPAGVAAPNVAVAVNGRPVGEATVAGEAQSRLLIDGGTSGGVDTRATLTTADTFAPPGDRRLLGVAVLSPATLVQQPRDGLALPPVGAWWRWLATVAAAWGVALALLRRHERAGVVAVGVVVLFALLAVLDRGRFWEYLHLPLLALVALQPVVWRRDLARWTAGALAFVERRWGLRPPLVALAALPCLAVAQALFSAKQQPLLALGIGAFGLVLALVGLLGGRGGSETRPRGMATGDTIAPDTGRVSDPPLPDAEPETNPTSRVTRTELLLLAAVLALAAAARFWRLGDIPFGLWRDEARHALVALRILAEPEYRPVYEPSISLPGLYPLLIAGVFRVFGESIASLRGLTAAAGVGTVAALWLVARQLGGPRVALVAALLAAVGSWRVSIDRLAFATAPTTLCTLGAFAAFLAGVSAVRAGRRGLPQFAAAGLLGGLAIYGYYPGRFALPVLAGAALVLIARDRLSFVRRAWPGLLLVAAVAALTLVPLGRYAVAQPDNFFRRTEQVFLLSERQLEGLTKLEAVERNLLRHAVMFNWEGEFNARHHAPRWPMLDAVTALLFATGLALTLVAALRFDFAALFLLGWLGALLAPSIVSVDAPSAVRAQDAAPAAYLLAAIGLVALWERLAARDAPGWLRRAAPTLVAAGLALAVVINLWLYFVRLPGDPRVLGKFQYVGETRAGLAVAAAHEETPQLVAYVPGVFLGGGSYEVLRFAAGDAPLRELPADPAALPPGPLLLLVIRSEERDFDEQLAAARRFAAAAGLRELGGVSPPGGGAPVYVVFGRDVP
jgi:4-amino-4-deoxy-L-arabinose transferase-like glycosyltransferase